MKLFYHPESCALAPHILLNASGLSFELVKTLLVDHFPPEYISLNPKKQVPFLELEPGTIMTEVPAIITTIAHLAPEKAFLGQSSIAKERSYEWMNYLSGQLHAQGFSVLFRPERFVEDKNAFESVRKLARRRINDHLAYIESKIDQLDPVRQNTIQASDAHLFVYFRWANSRPNEFRVQQGFPKLYNRMLEFSKMEPVQRAVQQQGIELLG